MRRLMLHRRETMLEGADCPAPKPLNPVRDRWARHPADGLLANVGDEGTLDAEKCIRQHPRLEVLPG